MVIAKATGPVTFYRGDPTLGMTVVADLIMDWTDTEIDCYVPDYASSGPVTVKSDAGAHSPSSSTSALDVSWSYEATDWTTTSTEADYQITNLGNYEGTTPDSILQAAIVAASNLWLSSKTIAKFNICNVQSSQYYVTFGQVASGSKAFTTVNEDSGKITTCWTTLDMSANFDSPNGYDLQTVMAHEFGHWVGLADMFGTDDNSKTMYGRYTVSNHTLDATAIQGAISIYGGGTITAINNGGNNPPPAPTNFSVNIVGRNIVLSWSENPKAPISHFIVYKNGWSVIAYPTTTSYTDTNAAASLPATYRIGAYSDYPGAPFYCMGESDTQPITVWIAPPVLVSPANGATGVSRTPTLTWNASAGATSYTLYVSGQNSFTVSGTSYTVSNLPAGTKIQWNVTAINAGGSATSATWSFTTGAAGPAVIASFAMQTSVRDKTLAEVPSETALTQSYPNPFNPTTNINYQLPKDSYVVLKVYDILGREVTTLVDGTVEAGYYSARFDGSHLSSGIYFLRLVVQPSDGGKAIFQTQKMLLMK